MDYNEMVRFATDRARADKQRVLVVRIPAKAYEGRFMGSTAFLNEMYMQTVRDLSASPFPCGIVDAYPDGSSRSSFFHR
jgi:hypothetical protein